MLNPINQNVANGRRIAARQVVMNSLASIQVQVWHKVPIYNNPTDTSKPNDLSFEGIMVSKQDEPNYSYETKGSAFILLDKFNGGNVNRNYNVDVGIEIPVLAQIEPVDLVTYTTQRDQIFNIPDWHLAEGDLLFCYIDDDNFIWYEIVQITGQTLMKDFGVKYVLNRRDELSLDPIKSEFENREDV